MAFPNQILEGVNYVLLPAVFDDQSWVPWQDKLTEMASLPVEMHVFDFKLISTLPQPFFDSVAQFAERIAGRNSKLYSLHLSESLTGEVGARAMEPVFNPIKNFPDDLYPRRDFTTVELRQLFLKGLAQAARAAVSISLQSSVACDETRILGLDQVSFAPFKMAGEVNLNNDFLRADLRLYVAEPVLYSFARAMLGPQVTIDGPLTESTLAELLNLIYGHAKSNLNDKESFRLPSVTPRIVKGGELARLKHPASPDACIMTMATPMGSFYLEVNFGSVVGHK